MKRALCGILCLVMCLVLSGCGEKTAPAATQAPSPQSLKEKAERALADYASLISMPAQDLEDMTGITSDMAAEFLYLQGEDALSGREVLVLRAADAAAADEIQKLVEKYLDSRKKETRNYLPEAFKLQENAAVERKNNTVVLCVGENGRSESAALLSGE